MSGEGALSVFARAKELEAQGRSIIHLELGEPDFHPGQSVIDSAAKALAEGKDRYCAVIGVPALRAGDRRVSRAHAQYSSFAATTLWSRPAARLRSFSR